MATCFNTLWHCPTVRCGLSDNGGEGGASGAAGATGQNEGGIGGAPPGCVRATIRAEPDRCEVRIVCPTLGEYSVECETNGEDGIESWCGCRVGDRSKQTVIVEAVGRLVCSRAERVCVP